MRGSRWCGRCAAPSLNRQMGPRPAAYEPGTQSSIQWPTLELRCHNFDAADSAVANSSLGEDVPDEHSIVETIAQRKRGIVFPITVECPHLLKAREPDER